MLLLALSRSRFSFRDVNYGGRSNINQIFFFLILLNQKKKLKLTRHFSILFPNLETHFSHRRISNFLNPSSKKEEGHVGSQFPSCSLVLIQMFSAAALKFHPKGEYTAKNLPLSLPPLTIFQTYLGICFWSWVRRRGTHLDRPFLSGSCGVRFPQLPIRIKTFYANHTLESILRVRDCVPKCVCSLLKIKTGFTSSLARDVIISCLHASLLSSRMESENCLFDGENVFLN